MSCCKQLLLHLRSFPVNSGCVRWNDDFIACISTLSIAETLLRWISASTLRNYPLFLLPLLHLQLTSRQNVLEVVSSQDQFLGGDASFQTQVEPYVLVLYHVSLVIIPLSWESQSSSPLASCYPDVHIFHLFFLQCYRKTPSSQLLRRLPHTNQPLQVE